MGIFRYIIFLGVLNIIFGLVWKWVFAVPCALLFTWLKFDKAMLFVKIFGVYLLVSLVAILTLKEIHVNLGIFPVIFYPLIGIFFLYLSIAQSSYEAQQKAVMTSDYELCDNLRCNSRYDGILIIASFMLFIVSLFVPSISRNRLTLGLMEVIAWAYELPGVAGWIIKIGGSGFLLCMIWYGFVSLTMIWGASSRRQNIRDNSSKKENDGEKTYEEKAGEECQHCGAPKDMGSMTNCRFCGRAFS